MTATSAPDQAQPTPAFAGKPSVSHPPRVEIIALTDDDALLEQIGQALDGDATFRHAESVDAAGEFIRPLRPCLLLLDARSQQDLPAAVASVQSQTARASSSCWRHRSRAPRSRVRSRARQPLRSCRFRSNEARRLPCSTVHARRPWRDWLWPRSRSSSRLPSSPRRASSRPSSNSRRASSHPFPCAQRSRTATMCPAPAPRRSAALHRQAAAGGEPGAPSSPAQRSSPSPRRGSCCAHRARTIVRSRAPP